MKEVAQMARAAGQCAISGREDPACCSAAPAVKVCAFSLWSEHERQTVGPYYPDFGMMSRARRS
ncbi:hypothetical protein ACLB1S_09695 [Escherichia coli]